MYGIFIAIYLIIVIKLISKPFNRFFIEDLKIYAILTLLFIIGQGFLFEYVTSAIVDRLESNILD